MITEFAPIPIRAIGRDERRWTPIDTGYHSKAELERQTGDYASAVTPEIADWRPVLSGEAAADLDDASHALRIFDGRAVYALGANDPAIGPMSAILLRTESASSSQIENLTASARQLALAEIDESEKRNALTVVGNVRAMEAAVALSDRIDVRSILEMHRELLRHQAGMEEHAGQLRNELVWIGRGEAGPIGAEFVAPQPERLQGALADLVAFSRRNDVPPLMQIAVAHAQFETIHPFVDGNGRTGRALAQAMVRNKGLVSHATVPISAGLLRDTEGYFDALAAFREGDAGPIVHSFAQASRFAAVSGWKLVDALAEELRESQEKLAGLRRNALAWSVLPRLVGQPIINARYLKRELGMSDAAAQRAADALVERGVLVERTGLRRNRIWQHPGMLAALDEYAAAIHRR